MMLRKSLLIALVALIFTAGSSLRVFAQTINDNDKTMATAESPRKSSDKNEVKDFKSTMLKENNATADFNRMYDLHNRKTLKNGLSTTTKVAIGLDVVAVIVGVVVAVSDKNLKKNLL